MTNLREKLQSLGYKKSNGPSKSETNVLTDSHGQTGQVNDSTFQDRLYKVIQSYPLPYPHGEVLIEDSAPLGMIGEWAKTPQISALTLSDVVFIDTETSGLVGGTGSFAFMAGIGLYKEKRFEVHQIFLPEPVDEFAFLEEIHRILSPFPVIVTFNGKSFDLPLLQTRFILNRMQTIPEEKNHIDLLHLARRFWRERLESCSLSELEKQILHVQREEQEVPGYLIPEIYFRYLKTKDFSLLNGVFYHNRVDILSLAALFQFMSRVLSQPEIFPLHSMDLASIARLYHDMGYWDMASHLYSQALSEEMPQDILIKTFLRNAEIHKKKGNLPEAIELWKKAAEYGNLEAHLELAKIYEHTLKNLEVALEWANRAYSLCNTLPLPLWKRKEWLREISHRIQRLEQKKRKDSYGTTPL